MFSLVVLAIGCCALHAIVRPIIHIKIKVIFFILSAVSGREKV